VRNNSSSVALAIVSRPLAVTRSILSHGSSLWTHPELGRGAAFRLFDGMRLVGHWLVSAFGKGEIEFKSAAGSVDVSCR
jgi:hypothetical protein